MAALGLFTIVLFFDLVSGVAALGRTASKVLTRSGQILQLQSEAMGTSERGRLNEAIGGTLHTYAAAQAVTKTGADLFVQDTDGLSPGAAIAACSRMGSWDGLQQEMLLSAEERQPSRRNDSRKTHTRAVLLGHEKIVLSPHHKTGFVFSKQALRCINANEPESGGFLMAFKLPHQAKLLNHAKVIHFTRDPLKLLVSTYLYNKEIADSIEHEPQIMAVGSAVWAKNGIKRSGMSADFMDTTDAETMRDYLKRVSVKSGLKVILLSTLPEWDNIESASKWCNRSVDCKDVSLDIVTASTGSYNQVWDEIFKFTGITPTPKLTSCLAMQDVNHQAFHASSFSHHCSSGKVPDTQRAKLEEQCIAIDKEVLNGRYTNSSIFYRQKHHLMPMYGRPR